MLIYCKLCNRKNVIVSRVCARARTYWEDERDILFRKCKPEDKDGIFFFGQCSSQTEQWSAEGGRQRCWGGEQLSHLNINQACRQAVRTGIMDIDAKD